jgi:diaminohydroxyphosphoribosylaminopyrimidine deaminase/5-amino-6-(5-phosphoribosylamino)uracil reductase
VHRWRALSSAIMTGVGTVLADDPSLTVRLGENESGSSRQPLRVILDTHLRTPPGARLLRLPGETLILTGLPDRQREARLEGNAVSVVTLPMDGSRLDLAAVMAYLGRMEINEVHLEAGATLSGALLAAGQVDELLVYLAPHLLGDAARGLFSLPGLECMEQRIGLSISDIRAVGRDWRITATVNRR